MKNRICKLESKFIQLNTESRITIRDCHKLVKDLDDTKVEVGKAVEAIMAVLLSLFSSKNSSAFNKRSLCLE